MTTKFKAPGALSPSGFWRLCVASVGTVASVAFAEGDKPRSEDEIGHHISEISNEFMKFQKFRMNL